VRQAGLHRRPSHLPVSFTKLAVGQTVGSCWCTDPRGSDLRSILKGGGGGDPKNCALKKKTLNLGLLPYKASF